MARYIPEFGYHIVSHADLSNLQKEPFKSHRRLKVFAQKGCKCVSCGVEGTIFAQGIRKDKTTSWDVYTDSYHPMTVDHIVPKSKGGKAHIDNLQPMCFSCNQLKANQPIQSPMNRKLARIAQITDIVPIPDADAIECAVVENGWKVVVKKGDYQKGDIAIYCEVDSWIPHELAPFLSKGQEPREYNGVKGERLRTMKLRGQISQGLLLPSTILSEKGLWPLAGNPVGHNLTQQLNIQKYEPPIPACIDGEVKGHYPSFIPKTDQERCQNLYEEIFTEHFEENYEVTVKLDGTSCTIYYKDGEVGVCGRNWEFKETESNTLWKCAHQKGIIKGLQKLGRNLAIQGEVIGEGIQKNQEKLKGQKFFVYDIYDIDAGRYLNAHQRYAILENLGLSTDEHVPILIVGKVLKDNNFQTVEDLLEYAYGPSLNPQAKREGLVFKSTDSQFTFKAISNKWLLKNE